MKIFVKVKPNARAEQIEQIDDTHFHVAVQEPPVDGRANHAIARALATHFNVAPSSVQLISGFSSKQKIFSIEI
ncbi:MAG: hypothetical protein A3B74_04700 [Candidatus Kerfeldbacteria bacterium RIFCSPHIGHO2_02_FULL_42_14]|uniref:Uncharacterized protein n=1 Tax=Candidatus Kerfeldbacteria bacterium RIFCSPHIGHO2_02_FULL_42_14 TaxID=1798540 RepID=A0A1G2AQ62_9BACT|nr:MAG: hypothetical protein A3B74_04700 [Candidatus Kerfeldbacteria bacterium RIFCSPHIGHO2_02_FULL_42_14]OGY81071.1 MAG: hypothetical protein A3E60_03420 [Candidatus Kerfeldbacteria bacterium RIFCSPHIGHO2_12_FULL_42_13]OGY85018.1 MAG: hypothetical protein A3I91_00455 [Candidatus Kerfeldbacteria bacterium RIFCSPLOWO2_02_FULL_42_19]OGY85660.1 MAG: hypothetical protein A3G01_04705 [Candidatus Kerfeldbacteria bacterium RIFCSPLOWO2_12_FULL_43_9]